MQYMQDKPQAADKQPQGCSASSYSAAACGDLGRLRPQGGRRVAWGGRRGSGGSLKEGTGRCPGPPRALPHQISLLCMNIAHASAISWQSLKCYLRVRHGRSALPQEHPACVEKDEHWVRPIRLIMLTCLQQVMMCCRKAHR